jgi:predicted transcriptional regulator
MNRHTDVEQQGGFIRESRERLELSREGLADKAGISLRTLERIEAGEVTARRSTLTVIANALELAEAA